MVHGFEEGLRKQEMAAQAAVNAVEMEYRYDR